MIYKNYEIAIEHLKKATDLAEEVNIEDFKSIWSKIESLPKSKQEEKKEWIFIIMRHYELVYNKNPRFYFRKGLDITSLSFYLKSIKEVITNGKK